MTREHVVYDNIRRRRAYALHPPGQWTLRGYPFTYRIELAMRFTFEEAISWTRYRAAFTGRDVSEYSVEWITDEQLVARALSEQT